MVAPDSYNNKIMRNINIWLLAGILLPQFSCKNDKEGTNIGPVRYTIPVNITEKKTLNLAEFLKFEKYISLETKEESLIKHIEKMYLTDSRILIFDDRLSEIFLFDSTGKFVRKFGKKGIGPGEYQLFNDVFFDNSTGLLYAHEAMKRMMYIYDLSGNLRQEIPTKEFWFRSFCKVKDGYWIYSGYQNRNTQFSLIKVNDTFEKIISEFLPQKEFFRTIIHTTFFQNEKDENFFLSPYSNIVYQLENNNIIPFSKTTFGNNTLPYERLSKMSAPEYEQLMDEKVYMGDITDFLIFNNKFYFCFSELAPLSTLYYVWYDFSGETTDVYDSCAAYKPADFPFDHIILTHPKGTLDDMLVFLESPHNMVEADFLKLQEGSKFPIEIDSNPILFFLSPN
jgi:hypothetical protein